MTAMLWLFIALAFTAGCFGAYRITMALQTGEIRIFAFRRITRKEEPFSFWFFI